MTAANRSLRATGQDGCCVLPPLEGADGGLVGMAVDYLLRASLKEHALKSLATVAAHGAQELDRAFPLQQRAAQVEREAVARINRLEPWRRALSDAEWSEYCRCCIVLARLEQWIRAGERVAAYVVEPLRNASGDFDDLARAMVDEVTLRDLQRVGRAAVLDNMDLRDHERFIPNPLFPAAALGGADGDLIVDGLLLDLKATGKKAIATRRNMWQLIGYALLDVEDFYGIRAVGIVAPRWRSRITWSLERLLQELSEQDLPIDRWRADFAACCDAVASLPAPPQQTPLAEPPATQEEPDEDAELRTPRSGLAGASRRARESLRRLLPALSRHRR